MDRKIVVVASALVDMFGGCPSMFLNANSVNIRYVFGLSYNMIEFPRLSVHCKWRMICRVVDEFGIFCCWMVFG